MSIVAAIMSIMSIVVIDSLPTHPMHEEIIQQQQQHIVQVSERFGPLMGLI